MESPWEDSLLERKTENDLRDLPKTMVAFANSVKPGHTAIILIGESDDGTIDGVKNPESIQQTVRKTAEQIYPSINWRTSVYEKDGKHCVRVEIEPSNNPPHFGGIAWVRKGSSTVKASDEMFQKLIELRTAKLQELQKWVGEKVSVTVDNSTVNWSNPHGGCFANKWGLFAESELIDANRYWVTLKSVSNNNSEETISLHKFYLEFDTEKKRLRICILYAGFVNAYPAALLY